MQHKDQIPDATAAPTQGGEPATGTPVVAMTDGASPFDPSETSSSSEVWPPIQLPFWETPPPFGGILPPRGYPDYLGKVHRFQFNGQASEYFGIWIVNILLTIVTLSFYAPWAKVRRLRYFYQNTDFFERSFDFTGLPTKILVGRLIALTIWGLYAFGSNLESSVAIFGLVLFYLAIPWLLRATLRFTARNSKFSNSRFYFSGTTKGAYIQFFSGLLITIFTLGLFAPVMIWFFKRYSFDHLYLGQLRFKLNTDWSSYMTAVYIPVFISVGVLIASIFLLGISFGFNDPNAIMRTVTFIFGAYFVGMVFIWPLIQARIFIVTWNSVTLGESQFKTDCNQWRFAWIVVTNWVVTILSLGLMSAWAAIRLYKYQVESLSLHLNDDPNLLMNMAQSDPSAIGEEISDIFDLDISL